jgi:RNA polymerase sigma factor (sigma-70 family)
LSFGPAFDAVLAAAQADAPWAFRRLYEWLAGPVGGFLRAQGVEDPEDVASEVFLSVFAGLASFRGDESQFRSWVFTIAYRRVVDARRARPRYEVAGLNGSRADGHRPMASAEEHALEALGTERVQQVLSQLVPGQRDVLALRVIADLTVEQVAAALGKSPGAVKALQRRALVALRRSLVAEGVPL